MGWFGDGLRKLPRRNISWQTDRQPKQTQKFCICAELKDDRLLQIILAKIISRLSYFARSTVSDKQRQRCVAGVPILTRSSITSCSWYCSEVILETRLGPVSGRLLWWSLAPVVVFGKEPGSPAYEYPSLLLFAPTPLCKSNRNLSISSFHKQSNCYSSTNN